MTAVETPRGERRLPWSRQGAGAAHGDEGKKHWLPGRAADEDNPRTDHQRRPDNDGCAATGRSQRSGRTGRRIPPAHRAGRALHAPKSRPGSWMKANADTRASLRSFRWRGLPGLKSSPLRSPAEDSILFIALSQGHASKWANRFCGRRGIMNIPPGCAHQCRGPSRSGADPPATG